MFRGMASHDQDTVAADDAASVFAGLNPGAACCKAGGCGEDPHKPPLCHVHDAPLFFVGYSADWKIRIPLGKNFRSADIR